MHNKNIIISPFSNNLLDGRESPKNWGTENWNELVRQIKEKYNFNVLQIGTHSEKQIKGTDFIAREWRFEKIKDLLKHSRFFISVDNFLPHFARLVNKRGVVIWGPSDSNIFGYKQNINVHGDKQYMREQQHWLWQQCEQINPLAFPTVEEVMKSISTFL